VNFFSVLLLIVSLALIVLVTILPSKEEGLGALGGGSSLFGKNKGLEALLTKITAGLGVAFFLLAIIANLV
jgi:preprotein translocase subunit SecG